MYYLVARGSLAKSHFVTLMVRVQLYFHYYAEIFILTGFPFLFFGQMYPSSFVVHKIA
jgi:hypothetical protein